jgi:hypothetical protein
MLADLSLRLRLAQLPSGNASLPSVGTDHRPHRKPQFWDEHEP